MASFVQRSMVFFTVATRLGQRFATAFRRHLASLCLLSFVTMVMRTMCRQTSLSWHRYLVNSRKHTNGLCDNKHHSLSLLRNGHVCCDHVLESWCQRLQLTAITYDCWQFLHTIFTPFIPEESYTTVYTQCQVVFMVSVPSNCAHDVT